MPIFKTTHNILIKPWQDELYNPNWMDSDKLVLPPTKEWTYDREMTIEDVDIWEVLYEASGGLGVYASWCPYAEFYLITKGWKKDFLGKYEINIIGKNQFNNTYEWSNQKEIEIYYGPNAQIKTYERVKKLFNIELQVNECWVENDKMWLYPNHKVMI